MHKIENRERTFDPARDFVAAKKFSFAGKIYRPGELFLKDSATLRQLGMLFRSRCINQIETGEQWVEPAARLQKPPAGRPRTRPEIPRAVRPAKDETGNDCEFGPFAVRHVGKGRYGLFKDGQRHGLATYSLEAAVSAAQDLALVS